MRAKLRASGMGAVGRAARTVLYGVLLLTPWPIRRRLLTAIFGYELHPTASIGFSWIRPKRLVMGPGALIHDLTVCRGIDLLQMDDNAVIGRGNWITGYPSDQRLHFTLETERFPALILGSHSAVTSRHIIDCTSTITIGRFSTVAGYRSQLLTHRVDVSQSVQTSRPITIGDYCFLGTNCVVLGGGRPYPHIPSLAPRVFSTNPTPHPISYTLVCRRPR